jgi:hypothetical protein
MSPSEETDTIDELFRQQESRVEDPVFTARVMQGLPRRRRRAWVNPVLLLFAAGLGSVLAAFWVPWTNLPAVRPADLLSPSATILLPWTLAVTVIASLIWTAMAAALRLE